MRVTESDCSALVFYIFLLLYWFPSKYCFEIYNITLAQALSQRQTLVSPDRTFELGFFAPNKSANQYVGIWYKPFSSSKVVWVANRENPVSVTDFMANLTISSNGNLEILDRNQNSIWSTIVNVRSNNSSVAILSDEGNLILKDGTTGELLWQSFEHPGDTLLPGKDAKLGVNAKTGEIYKLTSWKSDNNPSIGIFTAGIAPQAPAEAFIWVNGSTPHWRSGPWDKSKFVGVPQMNNMYFSPYSLNEDAQQATAYFTIDSHNNRSEEMLWLSSGGVLKSMRRNENGDWRTSLEAPESQCDVYGLCGPFGVCNATKSVICKCMKGFVPKSNEEWRKGNWTGGCVRRKQLRCEKNASSLSSQKGEKEGFWKMGHVKLPDFYEYVVPDHSDGDTCQKWCLFNCSCIAYAYVDGIGCLVWSRHLIDTQMFSFGGEDLFLRLPHAELVGGHKVKKIIFNLLTISSIGTIVVIVFCLRRWRATRKGNTKETTEHFGSMQTSYRSRDILQYSKQNDPSELPIFDFNTILVATNQFNPTNKLGQGGFGSVYKGQLHDGKEIAVKRLSSNSGQGTEEFKNEIILISKLQHRNLVRLLGYCIEKEENLLVYEFMPNKSLDLLIFDQRKRAQLNWSTRLNIIHGVARGLVYLHRDSCLRVIHRDLKVSNILLDEKMNPKISDFGLARIFQGTLDLANTQRVVGTLGYMSPEYALGGMFSEKSDVFSFGVLVLEIVSGNKNTNFYYSDQHLSLIAYAWQLWSDNGGLDFVDDELAGSCSASEAIRCIHVGLLCVQDHTADRPSMPDVVVMLSNNETNLPQPKQPIFTFQSSSKCDLHAQNNSRFSLNEATMSLIQGR